MPRLYRDPAEREGICGKCGAEFIYVSARVQSVCPTCRKAARDASKRRYYEEHKKPKVPVEKKPQHVGRVAAPKPAEVAGLLPEHDRTESDIDLCLRVMDATGRTYAQMQVMSQETRKRIAAELGVDEAPKRRKKVQPDVTTGRWIYPGREPLPAEWGLG